MRGQSKRSSQNKDMDGHVQCIDYKLKMCVMHLQKGKCSAKLQKKHRIQIMGNNHSTVVVPILWVQGPPLDPDPCFVGHEIKRLDQPIRLHSVHQD